MSAQPHSAGPAAAVDHDPLEQRYELRACPSCRGTGTDCSDCDATGATLVAVTGTYAPVTAGRPPQPRGDELPTLARLRERLTDAASLLARDIDAEHRGASSDPAIVRDDLVMCAEAVDRANDAAEARDEEIATLRAALKAEHAMRASDAAVILGLSSEVSDLTARVAAAEGRVERLAAELSQRTRGVA